MSNEAKRSHTKGPWKFNHREPDHRVTAPDAGDMICDVSSEANARLIAAAPELLQELRNAKLMLQTTLPETHPMILRIESAIAKAEGQPSSDEAEGGAE